jgi:hypothetical protein
MKQLTDSQVIAHLRKGPLLRDVARANEADRLARAQARAKERAAALAAFEHGFPKLEDAERLSLAVFHEASKKLEDARRKADSAYFARTAAQAEVDRRLSSIDGEIMLAANPLYRELCAKLSQISDDARKIPGLVEKKRDDPSKPETSLKVYTNSAARHARMFLPPASRML